MSTTTLDRLLEHFDLSVLDYLDRQVSVPIQSGLQFQGDVSVVPEAGITQNAVTPVPKAGVPVVRGEAGGNTHTLVADGDVFFEGRQASVAQLSLGTLTVAEGATAYLHHPEHGMSGIAPGTYDLRRQRTQAEEERLVAD